MDHQLRGELGRVLGAPVVDARPLAGGSINEAWAVDLEDESSVFVKTKLRAPAGMFAAEARGLEFLRAGLAGVEGLAVPAVLASGAEYLVLELITPGPPRADFDELLGRGLAALHRSGAGLELGLDQPNYIGSLAQVNAPRPDWPSFYRDCRLRPMLDQAGALISTQLRLRFDRLLDRLPELCCPAEPPARLHGDLWGGNLHRDALGRPVLIDPAVYVGHREIDLAMMRLFGGFSPWAFAAYEEAWPLAEGWKRRVDLYQLYPLLVHVNLFGGSYVGSVEAALSAIR